MFMFCTRDGTEAGFLPPSLQQQIHSAASLGGRLWSRSTFLPGFKDISRVCVPQLCCMAAIVSPCARPRPSSRRNKSKTLLDTRAQAVWSAHDLHSCSLPLSGPWVLRRGPGPAGQTDRALCTEQSGQTCLPMSLSPFYLFIQEAGQPCWLHRLGRSCLNESFPHCHSQDSSADEFR